MTLLVAWIWQGAVVAVVTTIAVQLVPRRAAAVRHALWWLALLLVFVLPLISFLPTTSVPVSATSVAAPAAPLTLPAPPSWLVMAGLMLWGVCSLVAVTRLVVSFVAMRHLVRHATPLNSTRVARLTELRRASVDRSVAVKVSNRIRGACAVGFSSPTLLVSNNLETALTDDQLQAILLHELAHLERRDDWTGLLQRVLVAIGGAHLAVWWISRQIDLEREAACDQRVVRRTGAPVLYATSLADAAQASRLGRQTQLLLAPGSSTTTSMLKRRVERLLHAPVAPLRRVWAGGVSSALLLAAAVLVVVQTPALVAFAGLPAAIIEQAPSLVALATREIAMASSVAAQATTPAQSPKRPRATPPVASVAPVVPALPPAATTVVVVPDVPVAPLAPSGHGMVVPAVPPAPPVEPIATLPSTPIAMTPPVTHGRTENGSLATPFVNFGSAVADASVSTGLTAARAGKAIGSWFKF